MIDISEYQQIPQCILRRLGGGGHLMFLFILAYRGAFFFHCEAFSLSLRL